MYGELLLVVTVLLADSCDSGYDHILGHCVHHE